MIFIGLIIAYLQLWPKRRATRREEDIKRHTDFLMRLSETWDSEPFRQARKIINEHAENLLDVMNKFASENQDEFYLMLRVPNFFETLGMLVRRGELSRETVLDLFESPLHRYYRLFLPFIKEGREAQAKRDEAPTLYCDFESLIESSKMNN